MKKIEQKNIADILALTPMQEGMLFHYLKEPESEYYFEQLSLRLTGKIKLKLFEEAWNFVIETNEMLRVVFRWEKVERPVQIILKEHKLQPVYYKPGDFAGSLIEKRLSEIKAKDRQKKFDLREVPFRITLCQVAAEEYEMIISSHHILFDGWSTGIILKEFIQAYSDLLNNKLLTLPRKNKFKEFVSCIKGMDAAKAGKFWSSYLAGSDTLKEIPIKKKITGTGRKVEKGDIVTYRDTYAGYRKKELETFVKSRKITLASLFYSAWGIVLHKYTNSGDVIFGTTVSGRKARVHGIEDMVGLFINTIPLQVQRNPHQTLLGLLEQVNDMLQVREEYENTPLMDIIEYCREQYKEELFDSILVIENYPLDPGQLQGIGPLTVNSYSKFESTHYDLTIGVLLSDLIEIDFVYHDRLFTRQEIERLAQHFTRIVRDIVRHPGKKMHQVELLSAEEKRQILIDFNESAFDYSLDSTVHRLFEEQAVRKPDNIAVVGSSIRAGDCLYCTYRELNGKADQLAYLLRERGIRSGTIAANMVERSLEMVVGMLAVIKAGGAYLPVDPGYPVGRVQYMLQDSAVEIVIAAEECAEKLKYYEKIDPTAADIYQPARENNANPDSGAAAESLLYIIYTSGSTGKPKGVPVKHKGFVNLVRFHRDVFAENIGEHMSQVAGPGFDAMAFEVWPCLLSCGTLYIADDETRVDPGKMKEYLVKNDISISFQPTVIAEKLLMEEWPQRGISLRALRAAGEQLTRYPPRHLPFRFYNLYGPTEDTVWTTYAEIEAGTNRGNEEYPTIGKPVGNHRVYILGSDGKLQPISVGGELCIAGEGLAVGYLNRPDFTAEKFVENPFFTGEKMYKTGDLARWLADGNIEFSGRIDDQVKIRGFRIELGEIEKHLLTHGSVKEAAVLTKQNSTGDRYLCAYIVPAAGEKVVPGIDTGELSKYLAHFLPPYMIPSYFAVLEKFPLTANGKLDRRALPDPQLEQGEEYTAPRDAVEVKLVDLWSLVLTLEKSAVGIDDNFFRCGGHSLKAASLTARIHKEFDVHIPLSDLFESPTIREQAEIIRGKQAEEDKYEAIKPLELKEYYVLSSAQKRLYFLQQMDEIGSAYNVPSVCELTGEIDKNRLESMFRKLIDRHESLRTSFREIGGEPVQQIRSPGEIEFKIECYKAGISDKFVRPFDLSAAPLLRVGLVRKEKERHILVVDMHHIIADGVSVKIFITEFMDISAGRRLPALRLQYKDFSVWQHEAGEEDGESRQDQETYWLKEFTGEMPVLELPTCFKRPAVQSFAGSSLTFAISAADTQALKTCAMAEAGTLFTVLFAIYNIFLAKITNQEDIVVGTPVYGRRHEDLSQIIGMFVNTLALRNYPAGEKTFSRFLLEVKEKTLAGFENQDYPFEVLVEKAVSELNLDRDASRNPLVDTVFALQEFDIPAIEIAGLKLKPSPYESRTAKFDLTLIGIESGENLLFTFEYSTKLFREETVVRFSRYFKKLISGILENRERKIAQIEVISDEDRHEILYGFNDTRAEYPAEGLIHQLFAEQAGRRREKIGVVATFPSLHAISYKELNKRADQLAQHLWQKGVKPGTPVAIMAERRVAMMVGILSILKAGGAYLPVNPDYPGDRIAYMLADSGGTLLLTTRDLQAKVDNIKSLQVETIFIEECRGEPCVRPSAAVASKIEFDVGARRAVPSEPVTCNLKPVTSPSNLAYIMYTSGSTGRPKGVLVEQRNVIRLVVNTNFVVLTEETRVLQTGAPVFDATTFEIWGPLLNGGQLVLVGKEVIIDADRLGQSLLKHHINTLWLSSPLFNQLTRQNSEIFSGLSNLLVGGDILSPGYINLVKSKNEKLKIINGYGPTENTTFSATFLIDKFFADAIPIGSPINNSTAFVLDKYFALQPIGIFGELWVGGDGVSRGYLNSQELTGERFFQDPFLKGKRLYRTGDITRFLEDGNIEFSGRIDHQVKIRGFRIELSEIENCLLTHDEVKEAVVIAAEDETGDKYLCAYFASDSEISTSRLRNYLSKELPEYMIPSHFIYLKALPLNPNGKVDRKALPKPQKKFPIEDYTAPRDEVEKRVVEIWSEILNIEKDTISVDSDFFELGGHSLKATLLVSKMHQAFDVDMPLTEIFIRPTIRELAEYIKEAAKDLYTYIEAVEKKEFYPLSSAQERLYLLQQMELASTAYNIPSFFTLKGPLEKGSLQDTFRKLVERHESLRTGFEIIDEEPVQKVNEKVDFEIGYIEPVTGEGRGEAMSSTHRVDKISNNFIRHFELSRPPLLRIGLTGLGEQEHILMLDMHHIISDGTSMGVFVREFMSFYERKELPALKVQYKEYSEWQSCKRREGLVKKQEEFWLGEFPGEIAVLHLPCDYPRPGIQSHAGSILKFAVGIEETRKLKKLVKQEGVTLFMGLLAVYNILLFRLSGQEDIVVGNPVAGRSHTDLEGLIGMFVNTLALRNYPVGEKTFQEFLKEVKERTIAAFENQDYQFEDLVEKVEVNRDASRNPLFDTMFSFHNLDIPEVEIPGLTLNALEYESRIAKFDLTLRASASGEKLLLEFEYSTKLFKERTIRGFIRYFKAILSSLAASPAKRLIDVEILSEVEKEQLLFEFNAAGVEYREEKTIRQLFEEQVERGRESTAVVGTGLVHSGCSHFLTYEELNTRANRVAILLRQKRVTPGTIVAIMAEPAVEMVIGIFGIIKSGGAYLPLDPDSPENRTSYIIKDCNARVLLTTAKFFKKAEQLRSVDIEIILIDYCRGEALPFCSGNECFAPTCVRPSGKTVLPGDTESNVGARRAVPNDIAYVIYTSGSTGTPKGVLICQRNLHNLVNGLNERVYKKYTRTLQIAMLSPYIFDASVKMIFAALLLGHTLHIVPREIRADGSLVLDFFENFKIELCDGTPAHLKLLVESGIGNRRNLCLRQLLIGGEALDKATLEKFFHRFEDFPPLITNVYGPTECSVDAALLDVPASDLPGLKMIPIGKPMPNHRIYILDPGKNNRLQPVGVPGELCIAGHGVADGYLNRVELTAEKFVKAQAASHKPQASTSFKAQAQAKDVFITHQLSTHQLIYRSGDLARWLTDGNIEFLGRIDYQVKIRGYRLEPEEIEYRLVKHEKIKEALVVVKKDAGGFDYLCAYIVVKNTSGTEFEMARLAVPLDRLRRFLSRTLPDYMIPAYFVQLQQLPLTPTGKIDRKSLPEPEILAGDSYVPPRNEIEEKLVEIWHEVLFAGDLPVGSAVGIDDNFFELGGHSLKAAILVSRIHKAFAARLPLAEIFRRPNIRSLTGLIEASSKNRYESLEAIEKREYYPLSSQQERLYILQQMEPGNAGYNMPAVLSLQGTLERGKFSKTFKKLITRHESLRTSFRFVNEEPVQTIHYPEEVEFEIEYYGMPEEPETEAIERFIRPFDLSQTPLLRVGLIKTGQESHILMVDMHHIISDGTSISVFIKEFMQLYSGQDLSPGKMQYKDFSVWQDCQMKEGGLEQQEAYWAGKFAREVPALNLPADFVRPPVQSFEGSTILFEIDPSGTGNLKTFALKENATLFMALLTMYSIFLSKLSGQEDILIGIPVAGRRHSDLENIIGMFVNTVVTRSYPRDRKTCKEFLNEVSRDVLEDFGSQDYQYEDLVEAVAVKRDTSRNPLFDVMLSFQAKAGNSSGPEVPGLQIRPYVFENRTAKFDITLHAEEREGNLKCGFEYSTRLFKKTTIERFISYFKNVIASAIENPAKEIGEIEIITENEKLQILTDFNYTARDFPADRTLMSLFTEQVEKTPERVAVLGTGHKYFTYKELNRKSNQLARLLREKGVEAGKIVGLMVDRSMEMIIGLYGILKAGGAYMPLAPEYPGERLRYMLEDSSSPLLLTQGKYAAAVTFAGEILDLDNESLYRERESANLTRDNTPEVPVYVIYTSGSTGKSKGTLIITRGFVNLVNWYTREFALKAGEKYLLIAPISFDLAQKNLFAPLITGGCLCLPPPGLPDYLELSGFIASEKQAVINCAPTVFYPFVDFNGEGGYEKLKTLRYVFLGGEPIQMDKLNPWLNSANCNCEIVNTYGPTECTDVVSYYRVPVEPADHPRVIPIGSPVDNVTLYVLDKRQKLLPVGISGEVCIGGIGLAPGYCNNGELTREKFIPAHHLGQKHIYRTGDLGRWLPGGYIEFLGRIDYQVKIRGLRIELGEIESQLLQRDEIKEVAVAVISGDMGINYLCAYLVLVTPGCLDVPMLEDLKKYLAKSLPGYMIPAHFKEMKALPLTPSGKVDRKMLPLPEVGTAGRDYAPPHTPTEDKLAALWSELLGIAKERIGIDAGFFDLGGQSLKATILAAKVHKEFSVSLPLLEIFRTPDIRRLSEYIDRSTQEKYISIEPVEEKEYYVLSSAQKRLYVLQQMDEQGIGYNIPSVLVISGDVNKDKVEDTFLGLIRKHESLRTSFPFLENRPVQRIHGSEEVKFRVEYYELEPGVSSELLLEGRGGEIGQFIRPFDLAAAPLVRVGLLKTAEKEHILVLDMHHIISDGISQALLIKDLKAFYPGDELPALKLRYRDYAEWQQNQLATGTQQSQKAYWLKQFAGEIPILNITTDFPRPAVQGFEGSMLEFEIGEEENQTLRRYALGRGATLYMVLLAVYNIFLSKLSSQEDIVVGSPVAGRRHVDLEKTVGLFINTLAMRNFPCAGDTFDHFLSKVKDRTLAAFANQDFPYEELVETAAVERNTGRNPLFDTMFALQNIEPPEIEVPGLKIREHNCEGGGSKFDLALLVLEGEEKLSCTFEYSTKLFKRETTEKFVRYFKKIVSCVMDRPGKKISEIDIISEEEKQKVLVDFNDTAVSYPAHKTIIELFEAQAAKKPDNTALVYADTRLTYLTLNERANRIARGLRKKGVGPGSRVALMLERSAGMVEAIFGILKAGSAYLPVEPQYPTARIRYILQDSAAGILLTRQSLNSGIKDDCEPVDLEDRGWWGEDTRDLKKVNKSVDLAYIIYTSGSTGRPKGVLVEQRSVVNLLADLQRRYPVKESDTYLLKTSFCFDVAVAELFGWYPDGGRLVILKKGEEKDPQRILDTIEREKVSHVNFVPSMFNAFVYILNSRNSHRLAGLRYIFLAGEALWPGLVSDFRCLDTFVNLVNLYGPTESTVYASGYSLKDWQDGENIPIGKPLANIKLYILDKSGHVQPVGIPGELVIAGSGLSRGYLNKPELTAEKFIHFASGDHQGGFFVKPPPWTPRKTFANLNIPSAEIPSFGGVAEGRGGLDHPHQSGLLYKTGDLARWLDDENIEFLGRIDHQVKIRGFRIELGEIEIRLRKHGEIKEAVVLAREKKNGEKYLCAYVVSANEKTLPGSELREYLSKHLPDYMVPSYFVNLDKIPLTPTGKIDRKLFPEPEVPAAAGEYAAPQSRLEKKLVDIWLEVLGRNTPGSAVGIDDNFFQLGGHSLNAVIVVSKIHKELDIKLSLVEFFKNPGIRGLAAYLEECGRNKSYSAIPVLEKREYYELSSAQKRLYILQQADLEAANYNMPDIFVFAGKLDREKFACAFQNLVNRHEAFRTAFSQVKGEVVQKIVERVEFKLVCQKISGGEEIEELVKRFVKPFDISKAPLLRVELIEWEKEKYLVQYDMHHLISDGISMEILKKEFIALYEGKSLEPVCIHYKDYAAWHNALLSGEDFKRQEGYWLDKMKGFRFTRFPVADFSSYVEVKGEEERLVIDKFMCEKIDNFCHKHGVTKFMFMMTIFNIILTREIEQRDITVGIPYASRDHHDLKNVIGVFLNVLLIRSILEPGYTFRDALSGVRESVLEAMNNNNYPYELLNEKIREMNNLHESELFTILFNYFQAAEFEIIDNTGFRIESFDLHKISPKYDVTLYVKDRGIEIELILVYKSSIVEPHRAKRIINNFLRIMQIVLEDDLIGIPDMDLADDSSKDNFELEMDEYFDDDLIEDRGDYINR